MSYSGGLRVAIEGVGKVFEAVGEPVEALRSVGFDVVAGQSVALVGANGAGKSTLLAMIAGTIAPTTGRIRRTSRLAALLELGVGMEPELTGRENLDFYLALTGVSPRGRRRIREDIIEFADLGQAIDRSLKSYSDGMSAKLAVAAVLHSGAELLLIDEALSVGDHRFQRAAIEKCSSLVDDGAALLFVTHDPVAAITACKDAIWLQAGSVVREGPSTEVVAAYVSQFNQQRELAITADVQIADVVVCPERFSFDTPVTVDVSLELSGEIRPHAIAIDLLPCVGSEYWWGRDPRTIVEYRSIEVIGNSTRMQIPHLPTGRSTLRVAFDSFPITPPAAELAVMVLDSLGRILDEATVEVEMAEHTLDTPVVIRGVVSDVERVAPGPGVPRNQGLTES